ncbi:tRNA delta(2)-isopentenylpyrophosphate transferase [Cynara cardunculus var. scolymus]|uniref:tRNA delta(2)-isopentenylpyrophosphate transferase n=2 Tax=Cynara cardunculus var. scolymus TaxID=59895 RepID=A0A103XVE7_CYNCS|nr:tRNA delta(2)-isopentenylpyrophosphate transferase [Cynara cardunculus var. scolymus]
MEPSTIAAAPTTTTRRRKRKIVVIMGPTGAGKSRLSIDLATRFFENSEIINSDKMQVYRGLDITTNKITMQEQLGVPHHLLGAFDPTKSVITTSEFRKVASEIISDIKSRRGLPLVVGGSNSCIYSLVTKRYDPKSDVFNGPDPHPVSSELRYECCFIWVDVCLPVLNQYLSKRVDEMLDSGMFEELAEFYRSGEHMTVNRSGLGQAIGVPEFETYFRRMESSDSEEDVMGQGEAYDEAVRRIKDNTCQLAKKQVSKILRLRDAGWELKRIDATEAFRGVISGESGGARVAEIWEKQVVEPSMKIVKHFLEE